MAMVLNQDNFAGRGHLAVSVWEHVGLLHSGWGRCTWHLLGRGWIIDTFKLWCWRRLLRVPWTARRSNQSVLKEINSEYSGRTDGEAEALILWPPYMNSWLIRKDPNDGKDWGQEKETTEDEMAGWHHQLKGYEFEQAPGDGEGQGSLACYSPWGCKESDTTKQLTYIHTYSIQNTTVYRI